MIRSLCLSILFLGWSFSQVSAQEWAKKMFAETKHDFGTVAASAKTEFAFEFENIYQEELHVQSVRTSCGCTTPRITRNTVKTFEKSSIVAAFNTQSFRGQRGATITVVFDKPFYAEVQLTVSGFIRGDVVFEPGEINFGEIEQSRAAEKKVAVSYAGRSDWRILDVRSAGKHFEVELKETGRQSGRVSYDMLVRMKDSAPPGYFHDQLTLVTDDRELKTIPLMVQGSVVAPVSVSPAALFLGVLQPGQKVTKNLILKGKKPFKVECIECDGNDKFEFSDPGTAEKNVFVIPVTFTAGDAGEFTQKITIKTSLGESVECCCIATASVKNAKPDGSTGK